MKLFKTTPISFADRRGIIKQNWARYGYGKRSKKGQGLITLSQKINSLMIAI